MSTTVSDVVWQPQGEYLKCRVADFMQRHGLKDWRELIRRSTEDIEWFWRSALEYLGVEWTTPYERLLDMSDGFAWSKWFVGGQLNIYDNCLGWHREKGRKAGCRQSVGAEHPALIWEGDDGASRKLTYGELAEMSSKVAGALAKLGVGCGDAVGIYMPMVPEVVAVLFGCLKIGAVAVPIFSGFGDQPLAARLADSEARVLFTADAGRRRGKVIPIKPDVDKACQSLPGLEHVVVLRHCGAEVSWQEGRDLDWHEIVGKAEPQPDSACLPAEHPSMYLYTSGTTGRPKGTVHTHAGALAQIAKELGFAFDVRSDDVFFWVTDIGWMMGPWEMIGVTFFGATMIIFEGAPNYPHPDRIWQIVERHKVRTLGISPTVIRVLRPAGDDWVDKHDLSSLRLLGSTGEPWDHDSYMWFFNKVGGRRCPIINISGGTEIVGCLLQPLPVMPLKPCTLGGPALGMDVDVFDENGRSVRNAIGNLVCKKPGPSMTKGFLRDPDRYIETYFSRFPDVWYHGDWAKVDADGLWFLFGRSDDTIKVAGKRVGPGEVEAILIEHEAVAEAAAIGVPHEVKGEGIVCFVVLTPQAQGSPDLQKELLDLVARRLGGPLKPEAVHFVKALPKTRSGKIVRGSIRKKYLGEPPGDLSSVENPDALEQISAVRP
ncbi:MAG TPA: AMP-binding protein [Candidatus Obscuribacterales bacterium]